MDPILEFRACFSTQLERFDGRPASLDAGLQSAAAVRLSAAGSLPPSEGSHRYYPSHRRSHASRCGHSSRAHSLRSEEHTSELQSPDHLVCRLLLEKKKHN